MIVQSPFPRPKQVGPELLTDPELNNTNGELVALGAGGGTSSLSGGVWSVVNGGASRNAPRLQMQDPFLTNFRGKLIAGATYRVTMVTTGLSDRNVSTTILTPTDAVIVPAGSPAGTYFADVVYGASPNVNLAIMTASAGNNTQLTSVSIRELQ